MKRLIAVLLLCLIVLPAMGQNKFIPPMKPRGFVTTAILAESTVVLRALIPATVMDAAAFADSARANGTGIGAMTQGQTIVAQGTDTLGGHTFPVLIFIPVDSTFLDLYGTAGFVGDFFVGPDSLDIDSVKAIMPSRANGDTLSFRLVFGLVPGTWTDSTSDLKCYTGTSWTVAASTKVIPPGWSYRVKIVEEDGASLRAVFAIRGKHKWY